MSVGNKCAADESLENKFQIVSRKKRGAKLNSAVNVESILSAERQSSNFDCDTSIRYDLNEFVFYISFSNLASI